MASTCRSRYRRYQKRKCITNMEFTVKDIFVMGVKKRFHRKSVGKRLIAAYEEAAKKIGYSYSQVKTVAAGHYPEYDVTNQFYVSLGYKPLEVFPALWDEKNPCQIYIKYLGD